MCKRHPPAAAAATKGDDGNEYLRPRRARPIFASFFLSESACNAFVCPSSSVCPFLVARPLEGKGGGGGGGLVHVPTPLFPCMRSF